MLAARVAALRGAVLADGGHRPHAPEPGGLDAALADSGRRHARRRSSRSPCWPSRRSSSASISAIRGRSRCSARRRRRHGHDARAAFRPRRRAARAAGRRSPGVRTAATETIASATLATFIGAGGLGDEIVRGLQTDDPSLLFAGAATVARSALGADAGSWARGPLCGRSRVSRRPISRGGALALLGRSAARGRLRARSATPIRVGSKNFTESFVIAEIYAQALEARGHARAAALQSRFDADRDGGDASAATWISIPSTPGTALIDVLHLPPIGDARAAVSRRSRDAFARRYGIVWLTPSPMNDSQALATTRARSPRATACATLSDCVARRRRSCGLRRFRSFSPPRRAAGAAALLRRLSLRERSARTTSP